MDRIDLLEAKVKQLIDLVQSLRDENQALKERLHAAEARHRDLSEERQALDRERDVVRDRIEQLLGDLAEVEAGAVHGGGEGAGPAAEAGHEHEHASRPHVDNPVLPGLT